MKRFILIGLLAQLFSLTCLTTIPPIKNLVSQVLLMSEWFLTANIQVNQFL